MRKIKTLIYLLFTYLLGLKITYADGTGKLNDTGIFKGSGVSGTDIKKGDIHIDDIPNMIIAVINYLMLIAGTISVIFIIIGAYQFLIGSISNDKTKGKTTVLYAIAGFTLSALSWLIIRLVIDNFIGS